MRKVLLAIITVALLAYFTTVPASAEVLTGQFTSFSVNGQKSGVLFESEDGRTTFSLTLRNLEKAVIIYKDHRIEEITNPEIFIKKVPRGKVRYVCTSNIVVVVE